ncbi:MAG: hypothetical protein J6A17_00835, partial [Bacilli bacterium]|nr:hypothetical protein [Bacilli bacterium]
MNKKDLSMIALVFFLTRCFFNLYTFTNLYEFLIISIIIFIGIIVFKKINIEINETKLFKWLYIISLLIIFVIILINASN